MLRMRKDRVRNSSLVQGLVKIMGSAESLPGFQSICCRANPFMCTTGMRTIAT